MGDPAGVHRIRDTPGSFALGTTYVASPSADFAAQVGDLTGNYGFGANRRLAMEIQGPVMFRGRKPQAAVVVPLATFVRQVCSGGLNRCGAVSSLGRLPPVEP